MTQKIKFIALFFLFLNFTLIEVETRKISIKTESNKIEATITDKKIKPKKDLIYFWYKSRKIQHTKGNYSGELLHGIYESYYLSGQLYQKGNFNKGLKNKYWTTFDKSGNVINYIKWRNGKDVTKQIKKKVIENEIEVYDFPMDTIVYKKTIKETIK